MKTKEQKDSNITLLEWKKPDNDFPKRNVWVAMIYVCE